MSSSPNPYRLMAPVVGVASFALGASLLAASAAPSVMGVVVHADNTLTAQEQSDGWRLLFDGKTTAGWRNAHADTFPARGWRSRTASSPSSSLAVGKRRMAATS